ncbi:hypothetical protein [Klebsiella pneumoniae IS10]|nr:hypothetical protein [Klebsiella pneumoniae IS10]
MVASQPTINPAAQCDNRADNNGEIHDAPCDNLMTQNRIVLYKRPV